MLMTAASHPSISRKSLPLIQAAAVPFGKTAQRVNSTSISDRFQKEVHFGGTDRSNLTAEAFYELFSQFSEIDPQECTLESVQANGNRAEAVAQFLATPDKVQVIQRGFIRRFSSKYSEQGDPAQKKGNPSQRALFSKKEQEIAAEAVDAGRVPVTVEPIVFDREKALRITIYGSDLNPVGTIDYSTIRFQAKPPENNKPTIRINERKYIRKYKHPQLGSTHLHAFYRDAYDTQEQMVDANSLTGYQKPYPPEAERMFEQAEKTVSLIIKLLDRAYPKHAQFRFSSW